MLVDIKQSRPDPDMAAILGCVSGGRGGGLRRIGEGMYLCGHWSIDLIVPVKKSWADADYVELGFSEYGVCDTPEQAVEKLRLREHGVKLFVTFVRIRRDEQSRSGGWRWHKWGDYIGNQNPQNEYLYDDRHIDEVYTFHVYQPK